MASINDDNWVINLGSPSRSNHLRVDSDDIDASQTRPFCARIGPRIRKVDSAAYEPQLITFGPHHYGKIPKFEETENVKSLYVKDLLTRFEIEYEDGVPMMLNEVKKVESRAKQCYVFNNNDDFSKDFANMMLRDGCFIVELFPKLNELLKHGVVPYEAEEADDHGDDDDDGNGGHGLPVEHGVVPYEVEEAGDHHDDDDDGNDGGHGDLPFNNLTEITNDILLLENQLPFFILETIYSFTKPRPDSSSKYPDSFTDLAVQYFQTLISIYSPPSTTQNFDHLLHLFHTCLVSEVAITSSTTKPSLLRRAFPTTRKQFQFKVEAYRTDLRNALRTEKSQPRRQLIHSATELSICGVQFKRFRKVFSTTVVGNFMNVEFKGGVLEIAALRGPTYRVLRNLMAMEQMAIPEARYGSDVTIYGYFISGLVEYCEDVELLKRQGILVDWREETQEVVKKLQNLCIGIVIRKMESRLWTVMLRILAYCEVPEDNFKAKMQTFFFNPWGKLMTDYCGSPWKALATTGATIVVVLTILQTYFAIVQQKHPTI